MRVVRWYHEEIASSPGYGRLEGERIKVLEGSPGEWTGQGRTLHLDQVQLLAPVRPGKVVCVGLNYRDHAEELGAQLPEEPVLFLKPPSSVIGPLQEVRLPAASRRVDYEAELAVVVARELSQASVREAKGAVLGLTCANDITARDLQKRDGQWTRAKSFDTFCPLGPWIETELSPDNLAVTLRQNGQVRQSSRTSRLVFGVPELLSFVSGVMTLEPGDVLLTGTPAGVGPVAPGDSLDVEVEGIGVLTNPVVAGTSASEGGVRKPYST